MRNWTKGSLLCVITALRIERTSLLALIYFYYSAAHFILMGKGWKTKSYFKWGACKAERDVWSNSWKDNCGWWRRESPVGLNNRTCLILDRHWWNCEQCLFLPNHWGTNCLFTAKTFPRSSLLVLFIYWNHSQLFIDITLLRTIRRFISPRATFTYSSDAIKPLNKSCFIEYVKFKIRQVCSLIL